ncbi:unnamed protein product [Chondrus crispus]|uniref:Uncharacterized protein n=1 Tax=Chondrus crispus TaxID=2769 RepID=R7Q7N9_CHOCR|nr:unnamed protein product [Chondrus crispus]CDF33406.1 unnamed protein product [Chondrus crispus]|eukprot:XP_005713209.1 unnamed protein product [Chondrus crispus]
MVSISSMTAPTVRSTLVTMICISLTSFCNARPFVTLWASPKASIASGSAAASNLTSTLRTSSGAPPLTGFLWNTHSLYSEGVDTLSWPWCGPRGATRVNLSCSTSGLECRISLVEPTRTQKPTGMSPGPSHEALRAAAPHEEDDVVGLSARGGEEEEQR